MTTEPKIAKVRLDDVRFHQHNVRRDLGDLRPLAASIKRFGVMQPVVVENRGDHLRLRAGHRRVAAARLAGLTRIPAVIHGEALSTDEWLVHAVQENVIRQGLSHEERRDTVDAMRREGMSWAGIAEAFGVTEQTARSYARDKTDTTPTDERMAGQVEKITELTRQGRSAAQIADELHLSPRQVTRLRNGHRGAGRSYGVKRTALREFIEAWQQTTDATPAQILDALARLIDGDLADALPPAKQAAA